MTHAVVAHAPGGEPVRLERLDGLDIWSTFGAITIRYQTGTLTVYNTRSRSG